MTGAPGEREAERGGWVWPVAVGLALAGIVWLFRSGGLDGLAGEPAWPVFTGVILPYLAVLVFGALIGAAELASRYRDAPMELRKINASYWYVGFNALMAGVALFVLRVTGAQSGTEAADILQQILLAGFGGAALLRSSFAKTKVGDTEVSVGPAFVIDTFLAAADRQIDRKRAVRRTDQIPELMRPVPPDFAAESLVEYCIEMMQNLSAAEQAEARTRVAAIMNLDAPSSMKSILCGLVLSEYTGVDGLAHAVNSLSPEIDAARQALSARQANRDAVLAALGDDDDEGDDAGEDAGASDDTAAGGSAQAAGG